MTYDSSGALRVVPLGGLGEIGLNCMLLEVGGQAMAIDCGVMFPDAGMLGIDLVIPDFEYLASLGDRFLGFVITHGHEDHIGGLPYALREVQAPVYATAMAAGLIRSRLEEHGLFDKTTLNEFAPRQKFELGPFAVDPIHVTHSIVDAVGLAITTPVGVVIHTGDFKIDQTPIDGRSPDLQAFAEYGSRGVKLMLSDSTNAMSRGSTGSERDVRGGLEAAFRDAERRIFFSTFSSHIHRIQQVMDLSEALGRKVAVVGRSLVNAIRIATEIGHLKVAPSLFVDIAKLSSLAPWEVTLLTSGSQGEALSALVRIAVGDHRKVEMGSGDLVILSSRVIPGNEKAIGSMVNHMYRRGARVLDAGSAPVHVSGHASRDELALMLKLVQPEFFVPVHGEFRQLSHHQQLAQSVGLSADSVFLIEDGQTLEVDAAGARRGEPVPAGRVFVDGKGIGDVSDLVLRDRRHLSRDGLLLAVLTIDQHSGELISGPDFVARGVFEQGEEAQYFEAARGVVVDTLADITPESRTDAIEVSEEVRRALRRYLGRTLDRRPIVLPYVMEM